MNKTFKIVADDMSDGYHTFDELYEHRCLLFLNLCFHSPERCAFKKDYATWFCLYLETPRGQISYHIPNKYLPSVISCGIKEDADYKWDGHTSSDVIERLKLYLNDLPDKTT